MTRFATVGVLGIGVNLLVFNLLRWGPLGPDAVVAGESNRVVTAKVLATIVSIAFAWWAHRGWTFRGGSRHRPAREALLFAAVNAVAIGVEAAVVGMSHHGLGFTSVLADNIASIIGIGLGTLVRYAGYVLLVFHADVPARDPLTAAADPPWACGAARPCPGRPSWAHPAGRSRRWPARESTTRGARRQR